MNALAESDVTEEVPKYILIFLDIDGSAVGTYLDSLLHLSIIGNLALNTLSVPLKLGNHNTNNVFLIDHL